MKCKICGASLKDIKAVGAHYRKKHPSKMKARKPKAYKREGVEITQRVRTPRMFKIVQGLRKQGFSEEEILNAYYDE